MSEEPVPYTTNVEPSVGTPIITQQQKDEDIIVKIPLNIIDRPEKSIRMSIDLEWIRELSESIQSEGLLQPILVHKKGERYGIIAGDCRFLAVSRLKQTHINAIVKNVTEEQIHIQRTTENILRHDMTPIEEANAFRDLIDKFHISIEYIAGKTGKSPGIIKRKMDLLRMPERLINAIHTKKIGYSIAEILDAIKDPAALNYYLDFAIENGITSAVARQWVKDWQDATRRAQTGGDGIESLPPAMSTKPTFYACDTCSSAVEISQVKALRTCPDCFNLIRANLSPAS
jgi:ParB family chromosome partitioning protein